MVSRRSLLASTAALAGASLAGCAGTLGEGTDRHYVDVINGDEEPHVLAVTITDEAGETLFDDTYDLGARSADENEIVDGSPATVAVALDDDPVRFPWAPREGINAYPEGCSRRTSASLGIYYRLQSDDDVTPMYGCETVRDR